MQNLTKTLEFPLAGVSRRGPYRQHANPPYTAPWAVNVRTNGPSEQRRRGGSRPGLAKLSETNLGAGVTALFPVTFIDAAGVRRRDLVWVANGVIGTVRDGVVSTPTAELEGPDGVDILTDTSATIDFSATVATSTLHGTVRAGRVYLADDVLRSYDPGTGVVEPVTASVGIAPVAEPVIALYRDRIVLAGSSQAYYCSRVSDPTDWDYGAAIEDPSAAVAGQVSSAGLMGEVVTALVPVHDQVLVIATQNTLWYLRGDPTSGKLENVSDELGIVGRHAWALSPDGLMCFLTHDGLYLWPAGSEGDPQRFSSVRVPDELRNVDTAAFTVSMAYDPTWRGFHLFLTPADGFAGYHWWVDPEAKALWPQRFARGHQPLSSATLTTSGLGIAVAGCRDGYLRYFKDEQATDDGLELASHVFLGPIHLAKDDVHDGFLAEIHGAVEELSEDSEVTWRVVMGESPAEAAEAAFSDLTDLLDGLETSRSAAKGVWAKEGKARVQRPRSRGPWVVVWLSCNGNWSYEAVTLVARQVGRLR